MATRHELAPSRVLLCPWTAASIAVPQEPALPDFFCPVTILGTCTGSSVLHYIVLRGLRKTKFGGAGVSFVLMVVGVVLECVCKRTWVSAGFLGLAVGGSVDLFAGSGYYAEWVSTTRPDQMRLSHARATTRKPIIERMITLTTND
jgi:hypothetical protein